MKIGRHTVQIPSAARAIALLFTSIVLFGCYGVNTQSTARKIANSTNSDFTAQVADVNSKILHTNQRFWAAERITSLQQKRQVESVFFQTGESIYAADFKEVLKLSLKDGKWQQVSSTSDVGIKGLVFDVDGNAFIAGYRTRSEAPDSFTADILTSSDGGTIWRTVLSIPNARIEKISAHADGIVCAVGQKKLPTDLRKSLNLIVCSTGNTNRWDDLSDALNRTSASNNGFDSEFLRDIVLESNNDIVVVSNNGRIYGSKDGGKAWDLISYLPNEREQTCICRLGRTKDGQIWLGGGAAAEEGVWGMVAVRHSGNEWTRFRLNGFYFSDIEFISSHEIIAVGAELRGKSPVVDTYGSGVILYSNDGGANWRIIRASVNSRVFIEISNANDSEIYVVGRSGEIIRLRRL